MKWLTTPLGDIDMSNLCECPACWQSIPYATVMRNRAVYVTEARAHTLQYAIPPAI
jgi:hypothetical protein